MKIITSNFPLEVTNHILEEIRTFPKDQFLTSEIFAAVSKNIQVPYSKVVHVIERLEKEEGISRVRTEGRKIIFQRKEEIYSDKFNPVQTKRNIFLNHIEQLPNIFTLNDIPEVPELNKTMILSCLSSLVHEGKLKKNKTLVDKKLCNVFSKTPTFSTGRNKKLDECQFTINAIKNLRTLPHRGIDSITSGFDASFKNYFDTDPIVTIQKLVREGKIIIQPRRKSVMMYLPEDIPKTRRSKGTPGKISDGKYGTESKEITKDKVPFGYLDLGKSIEALLNEKSKRIQILEHENKELVSENQEIQKKISELKLDHQRTFNEITRLRTQVREQKEKILDLNKRFNLNSFK